MTDEAQTEKPRRWVKPLLISSLAINFLIGGAVIGAMVVGKGGDHRAPDHGRGGFAMLPFLMELSKDDRDDLRKTYRKGHASFKVDRAANKAIQTAIIERITAQPFDRTALEAEFTRLREAPQRSTEVGHSMLIETIAKMSDVERDAYAKRIKERLEKRKKRPKK